MKPSRLLPPFLVGTTLLFLGANAIPTLARKQRLEEELTRLRVELEAERERARNLHARLRALETDPFFVQRLLLETWAEEPPGAAVWLPEERPAARE